MITLNYRDSRPIYEQIQEAFKRLIVTGAMEPEERLPSVRTLATQLSINPNTIQRAYAELEREGYCYSVPGKGSFVTAGADMSEKRRKELQERLCALAAELKYLGATDAELIALIQRVPERANAAKADSATNTANADGKTDTANAAGDKDKEEENA
ncbi:MAG: GntR family transcriptional regulator [Oscillibacter sp.]|nr:GntR family transcriptional regulator [Oscillibacter sp.]